MPSSEYVEAHGIKKEDPVNKQVFLVQYKYGKMGT